MSLFDSLFPRSSPALIPLSTPNEGTVNSRVAITNPKRKTFPDERRVIQPVVKHMFQAVPMLSDAAAGHSHPVSDLPEHGSGSDRREHAASSSRAVHPERGSHLDHPEDFPGMYPEVIAAMLPVRIQGYLDQAPLTPEQRNIFLECIMAAQRDDDFLGGILLNLPTEIGEGILQIISAHRTLSSPNAPNSLHSLSPSNMLLLCGSPFLQTSLMIRLDPLIRRERSLLEPPLLEPYHPKFHLSLELASPPLRSPQLTPALRCPRHLPHGPPLPLPLPNLPHPAWGIPRPPLFRIRLNGPSPPAVAPMDISLIIYRLRTIPSEHLPIPLTSCPSGIYIHVNDDSEDEQRQLWLYTSDGWKDITNRKPQDVAHPVHNDRCLTIRQDGTPNWILSKGKKKQE
ncbi:hypothetical protein C8R47DRAFT_1076503 [Mycena vitilis]|nr:hypothetical protein C8R47DRAFT_1076503 [Mycena vitilis]